MTNNPNPNGDHIFVVGIRAVGEKEREYRIDVIREELLSWPYVTDVMDYDGREPTNT